MKPLVVLVALGALFVVPRAAAATAENVDLKTATGTLSGTLLLPDGARPVPVALIIAGSGPTDRDGNSALIASNNDSLKMLAEVLADAGFASLRYDKRGIAASVSAGPSEADLRFEHYVDDAMAWVAQLARDSRLSEISTIGHSEGALIGMLAARPDTPFISIAGAADSAATLIRRQLKDRMPPDLALRNEAILVELEAGRPVAEVPPQLLALYRSSVQPYMISWIRHDPRKAIGALKAPCLILQGTTDIQVSVSDAEALHAANGACELKIIEGMNHVLKAVPDDPQQQVASYGDPSLPLVADLSAAVIAFLRNQ